VYLRDIGVSIVKSDDMPPHLPSIYLREAEHVVEIFLHFLPRNYTLDGTAKTNLTLGPIPDADRYRNGGAFAARRRKPEIATSSSNANQSCRGHHNHDGFAFTFINSCHAMGQDGHLKFDLDPARC
jgi:hypothetical protein